MGAVAWSVYSVSMYMYVHLGLIESLSCPVQSGMFFLTMDDLYALQHAAYILCTSRHIHFGNRLAVRLIDITHSYLSLFLSL